MILKIVNDGYFKTLSLRLYELHTKQEIHSGTFLLITTLQQIY